jgi:methyl-accepting chemotaxis protein
MNFSKLSTKLTISMLAAGLLPLFIAVFIVLNKTNAALEARAFDQLESLQSNKAQQIEDYFAGVNKLVRTLSNSIMIADAMNEFQYSFHHDAENSSFGKSGDKYKSKVNDYYKNDFSKEYQARNGSSISLDEIIPQSEYAIFHQYQYIANSEYPLGEKDKLNKAQGTGLYNVAHEKYHPILRDYQNEFGFYDIFLVEPEHGNIVYSVFKEIDFATSLLDGPYRNSNIAEVFKEAKDTGQASSVFTQDFSVYLPSFDAPASFIASPIFDGDRILGVLIFQMPTDKIGAYMEKYDGLGETGQSFLLGSDLLMRSQSRFSQEPTLISQRVESKTAKKVFAGETGIDIYQNADGHSVLSAYSPLNIDGLDWAVLSEIHADEAFSSMSEIKKLLAGLAIVLMLFVFSLAYFMMRSVSKQLGGDPVDLLKIANDIINDRLDRDSTKQQDEKAKGVYAAMIKMQDTLKESINKDRRENQRIERIKQALDNVSSCVVVADVNLEVIYENHKAAELFSAVEPDLRVELPNFNAKNIVGSPLDVFYKDASQQRNIFKGLTSTLVADLSIGSHHFRTTVNPIMTSDNERIGIVIEWKDMTAEIAVEDEVQSLVDSALDGDLSQRISLDNKSGFFSRLSIGINDLVNVSEQVINDTIRVLSAISHGDLNQKIDKEYKGSFNQLKTDANNTIHKLTEIVSDIKESSTLVSTAADEISRGNMDLSQRTESQAASLEETSASMEEMTSSVKQNADNSKHANELAINASQQAQKSGEVVNEAVTAMAKINDASNKIAEIISVIDEIAFQTNLLALNAAVEAARAGEQGRGFAVVATEVRNLAGRSATAAKEIKELIEDSVEKVEEGSRLVNQSGTTLQEIMESIKKVTEIVGDITYASSEQATGIEQVNRAIINMDETTQNNAALVEEAAAAAESMNEQSNELMRLIGFFNADDLTNHRQVALSNEDLTTMSDHNKQSSDSHNFNLKRASGDDFTSSDWEQF